MLLHAILAYFVSKSYEVVKYEHSEAGKTDILPYG